MKIEKPPVSVPVEPEKENTDASSTEAFMFELMMNEWRSTVLSSDGLTEEDNREC